MNAEDIRVLLDKNEDEHIEFKKAESSFDFDKLVDYSIALANEHGGSIVLGITDRKPRRIVGTSAYLDDLAKIKERLIAQVRLRIDVEEVPCPEGRVLVFHVPSRPIGMLANAEVVFEYRSSEASGPAQQRIEFRQGFFSFFDKLWEAIDLRNTRQHFQDGFFIWDVPTFNERAIREAILNAVSHREYRMAGSVFVRQYGERIEITNPGGLPPGVTLDTILWMQAPRNRRLAEAFSRCGLVERSGQGMNRIYETCILESKQEPDFTHSDTYNFWITLHGSIRQPEFLRLLEKIGRERLVSFSLEDLIVIQAVYDGRPIGDRFKAAALRLLDEGLLERNAKRSKNPWILSRKLYSAIGKSGVHTRKKGLDRETNKALLLKHIESCEPEGARMEEFLQVLPSHTRRMVQTLLASLVAESRTNQGCPLAYRKRRESMKYGAIRCNLSQSSAIKSGSMSFLGIDLHLHRYCNPVQFPVQLIGKTRKPHAPQDCRDLRHEEDKRANIPTAEYESLVRKEEQPRELRYPRNTDLDPQLVWRGKDEQDWSNRMILGGSLQVVASLTERGNLRAGIAE